MNICDFIVWCPMFQKFVMQGNWREWADAYCHANAGAGCARRALRSRGRRPDDIPRTLLPNGRHVRSSDWILPVMSVPGERTAGSSHF